jgi:hypothetical protein
MTSKFMSFFWVVTALGAVFGALFGALFGSGTLSSKSNWSWVIGGSRGCQSASWRVKGFAEAVQLKASNKALF